MIGYVIWGEEEAIKWYNGGMNQKEAAEYLGISTYMIRKLVKENKIPYSQSFRGDSALFHQTILDSWLKGEFIPGRVELVLDEESIDIDHGDALREHYQRYPELLEKIKEQELSEIASETSIEVKHDGVMIRTASSKGVEVQVFLSNPVVDQLIKTVQKHR